jgi:origin recognition complex subunit 4
VLFVLEDIDYYVETTKQLLLYKILDMFTYLSQDGNVRFVFLATSVKVDVVDSFEKRIKSRFSHRLALFYDQELSKFMEILQSVFNKQL